MKSKTFNRLSRLLSSTVGPKIISLALLAITLFFASNARAASPGALDLTFGNRGTATYDLGIQFFMRSHAIVVQPDGKVVVAGRIRICTGPTCNYSFLVVRYNTNGTLDNSFDMDGAAVIDYFGQDEAAYAVAVQADGKIVVAGGSLGGNPSATNVYGFKVARLLADGTLDSSFDTDGRAYESFDDLGGTPQSMIIQPDGKIVVAGTDGNAMLFMTRFNSDGNVDTGFATNGRIASNAYDLTLAELAIQSDGKIIVGGRSVTNGSTLKLFRFNTNGTPDGNFGTGGVVTSTFAGNFIPTIAVQADDKILVSGDYNDINTPPLRRFNADGTVDGSFVPNHGETINSSCRCTQNVTRILTLPDGRFYLVGSYRNQNRTEIAVSRYLSTGTIDYSYGYHGLSLPKHTNSTNINDFLISTVDDAAVQADGKVVVASTNNSGVKFHVTRVTATVTAPSMRGDFDGDRKTDFAVFRPSNRFWYVLHSSDGSVFSQRFGADGDVLTPSDFNYDLKTDLAVYRPSENTWYISSSLPSGGGTGGGPFGQSGDIRVPEDYDGDGYTDLAVFRPSDGTWTIRHSGQPHNSPFPPIDINFPFGLGTDKPVPADYDGDGRADLAVFRPSNGTWYILRSSDGLVTSVQFGISTDKTVHGDYDGDLKTDVAIYRDGEWYVLRSSDNAVVGISWGIAADKPVPGDYDGDGKFDFAVFRPSTGAWYVFKSSDSTVIGQSWGISEDTPIPFTFVR